MPTLEQLSAQVDELQAALDAEQQQVADLLAANQTTIDTLTQANADLQVLVADGGTAEARQAVSDKITAAIADIKTTVPPTE